MRGRVLVFPAVCAAIVGCGITFSPGDYGGGTTDTVTPANDAGPRADVVVPVDGPVTIIPPDTGPAGPALHIVLLAGTKAGGAETNDVWQFPVDASGNLGAIQYLQPAPLSKSPLAVGLAGGKLLSAVQGTSSRVVQIADFANGAMGPWTTAVVENPPVDNSGSFFAHTSLVVAGGQTTETGTDGDGNPTSTTTNHPELYVSALTGGSYVAPNNVKSATALPAAAFGIRAFTYKDFAYVRGEPDRSMLYIGKVDDAAGLTGTIATNQILNPQDGKGHTPSSAMACAGEGHVFIAGGDKQTIVLTATVDDATGAIGTWKTGSPLPNAITNAGCAVFSGALYLFGGTALTGEDANKTDATTKILRARFAADGTMQAWEVLPQVLPGARSNVFALTY